LAFRFRVSLKPAFGRMHVFASNFDLPGVIENALRVVGTSTSSATLSDVSLRQVSR